jgi:holo-ACP synthase
MTQKVTLEDMLQAREERVRRQQMLLKKYGQTLIALTLNIPGEIKYNESFQFVFREGIKAVTNHFEELGIKFTHCEAYELFTGCEAYFIISNQAKSIKHATIAIEENHPFGRLFDFDVFSKEGVSCSRSEVGQGPRKCFICEEVAQACGRSKRHTKGELQEALDRIINLTITGGSTC